MSILFSFLKSASKKNGLALKENPRDLEKVVQRDGGRIIVFTAYGLGNAIVGIMPIMLEPLRSFSSGIYYIDFNAPNWRELVKDALSEPVWFVASYFGVGLGVFTVDVDGHRKELWEHSGVPFIRFYGDIPAYYPDKHAGFGENIANIYLDTDHFNYFNKWFSGGVISAVIPPVPGCVGDVPRELDKKNGKIVFPKNGGNPEGLRNYWRYSLPKEVAVALESIAEECSSSENIDRRVLIDECVVSYFAEKNIGINRSPSAVSFLTAQIDDYLRRVKSTVVVKGVLDLPVVVNGVGWDHIDFDGKSACLDRNCDFSRTSDRLSNYLAIIDSPPNTHYLVHDRIERAVGSKTTFITAHHALLEERMVGFEECFYSYSVESVANVVAGFLDSPERTVDFGVRQSKKFCEEFSLEDYAKRLMSLIDIVKMNCSGRPRGTQDNVDFPSKCFL